MALMYVTSDGNCGSAEKTDIIFFYAEDLTPAMVDELMDDPEELFTTLYTAEGVFKKEQVDCYCGEFEEQ